MSQSSGRLAKYEVSTNESALNQPKSSIDSSSLKRSVSIIKKLGRCFCVNVEYATSESDYGNAQILADVKKFQDVRSEVHETMEQGDTLEGSMEKPKNPRDSHALKPPQHPITVSVDSNFNHEMLQTVNKPHLSQMCKPDLEIVRTGQEHHFSLQSDSLNPIIFAATEVASASKLLSNALGALKAYSNMVRSNEDNQRSTGVVQKSIGKSTWDFEAVVPADCCSEIVLDLPPLSGLCHIEAHRAVLRENVFHRAANNVRICVEDTDAIEPVRCGKLDENPAHTDHTLLGKPNVDTQIKSPYPDVLLPSSRLTFNFPTDSIKASPTEERIIQETQSTCHTLVTGTFQPFSTEETQVTEVDDRLTTDESEASDHSIDCEKRSHHIVSFTATTASKSECDQDKEHKCATINPRSLPRNVQSGTGDCQPVTTDSPRGIDNFDAPASNTPGVEPSRTETCLGDQIVPIRITNSSKVKSVPTKTVDRATENCGRLRNIRSRNSKTINKPLPVPIDNDELTYEVMYQRNNHNSKLTLSKDTHGPSYVNQATDKIFDQIPSRLTFLEKRSNENTVRCLIESFRALAEFSNQDATSQKTSLLEQQTTSVNHDGAINKNAEHEAIPNDNEASSKRVLENSNSAVMNVLVESGQPELAHLNAPSLSDQSEQHAVQHAPQACPRHTGSTAIQISVETGGDSDGCKR